LNELDAQALRREVWRLRNAHAQVTRERDGLQHGMRLMKTQMLQLKLEMEQRTLVEMQLESGMAELEQLFIDMQSKLATAQAGWRAKNQALRAAKKQQEATLRGLERQHAAKTDSLQAALQKRAKEADALRARVRGLEADQRRLKQQQRHAADTGEVTDLHCASLVRMMEV
jgi:chromosome segregation ATPase